MKGTFGDTAPGPDVGFFSTATRWQSPATQAACVEIVQKYRPGWSCYKVTDLHAGVRGDSPRMRDLLYQGPCEVTADQGTSHFSLALPLLVCVLFRPPPLGGRPVPRFTPFDPPVSLGVGHHRRYLLCWLLGRGTGRLWSLAHSLRMAWLGLRCVVSVSCEDIGRFPDGGTECQRDQNNVPQQRLRGG